MACTKGHVLLSFGHDYGEYGKPRNLACSPFCRSLGLATSAFFNPKHRDGQLTILFTSASACLLQPGCIPPSRMRAFSPSGGANVSRPDHGPSITERLSHGCGGRQTVSALTSPPVEP